MPLILPPGGERFDALPHRVGDRDNAEPADANEVEPCESRIGLDRSEGDGAGELRLWRQIDDCRFAVFVLGVGVRIGCDRRDADDRFDVARVIDEREVALLHRADVLQRHRVGNAVPRRAFVAHEVVPGVRARLRFEQPIRHAGSSPRLNDLWRRRAARAGPTGRAAAATATRAAVAGGGFGQRLLDGLRDLAQEVHELDLGHVQRLDLDVRHDARLERFELLPLGVGDAHPALLLARERLDLAVEFRQRAGRLGVFRDRALGLAVTIDGRVLRDELPELFRLVHDLLRVNCHRVLAFGWKRRVYGWGACGGTIDRTTRYATPKSFVVNRLSNV